MKVKEAPLDLFVERWTNLSTLLPLTLRSVHDIEYQYKRFVIHSKFMEKIDDKFKTKYEVHNRALTVNGIAYAYNISTDYE